MIEPKARSLVPPFVRCLAWLTVVMVLTGAVAQSENATARTVTVSPSGVDDTEALRAAFDTCLAAGPGCIVRLTEGTFHTRQLDVVGFHGTFEGAGQDVTIVEPITPLEVSPPGVDVSERAPDRGKGPTLATFRESDVTIRDLGFRVTEPAPSEMWRFGTTPIRAIAVVLSFEGQHATIDLERVSIESGEGVSFGANLLNGVFVGPGPNRGSGTSQVRFRAYGMRIQGPLAGISITALEGSTVLVHESSIDAAAAVEFSNVGTSLVELRGNELTGSDPAAISIVVGDAIGGATHYVVVENTVRVGAGDLLHGLQVNDLPGRPTQVVWVERNTFELGGSLAAAAGDVEGLVFRGNVVRGRAQTGVRVGSSRNTPWLVQGNDFTELEASVAAVVVTGSGRDAIVVCGLPTTVVDDGRGTLLACD